MTLALPEQSPDHLLSPKEAVEYLQARYGLTISIESLYSMTSRGTGPKPTYFRNRPRFTQPDLDEWVRNSLSDKRKRGRLQ
jgi:hypothetical protein